MIDLILEVVSSTMIDHAQSGVLLYVAKAQGSVAGRVAGTIDSLLSVSLRLGRGRERELAGWLQAGTVAW